MTTKPNWHELMTIAEADAREGFADLCALGFKLKNSHVSKGSNARYDGWEQTYRRRWVSLRVCYYEMELAIFITRYLTKTNYFFIDYALRNNASGFQGCMFPPEKLPNIIRKITVDLTTNYKDILLGDKTSWKKIAQLEFENKKAKKENEKDLIIKYQDDLKIKNAMKAFRDKDYKQVCTLLKPLEADLTELQKKKLNYAQKKINS